MSINDNNRLIVRTFAYAWKFKKLYEKGIRMEDIMKQEKMTKRTIYKYLNLAYLSPKIVNQLLSGTLTVNLQTLFDIASKNLSFEEQEKKYLIKRKNLMLQQLFLLSVHLVLHVLLELNNSFGYLSDIIQSNHL